MLVSAGAQGGSEEAIGFPGLGTVGSCELPDVGAKSQTHILPESLLRQPEELKSLFSDLKEQDSRLALSYNQGLCSPPQRYWVIHVHCWIIHNNQSVETT